MAAAEAETARLAALAAQEMADMAEAEAETARAAAVADAETAEMARAAAVADAETAEMARAAAVTAAEEAETARATAVMEAAAAEEARMAAVADAALSEEARAAAVMAAEAAEAARATAVMEAEAAEAARATAVMEAEAAEAARATAVMAAEAAEAARATAVMEAEAAEAARATAVMEAEAAEAARATAVTAAEEAEAARVAAVERAETAEEELAVFKAENADAVTAAGLKERIARAAMVQTAIGLDRVGTSYTADATPDEASGVAIPVVKRDAAGKITVDVNGDTADDYAGGETTASSNDWNSVTMTKTDVVTGSEDTVVIYTDIAAPTDKLLTAQYEQMHLDEALAEARVAKAQSDGFPSGPGVVSWSYTGEKDERAKTVAGTFDGVAGQFTCTAVTACTVMTNNKGELTASADWRFTPVSPLTDTVKIPDASYAYFGWWLNKPTKSGGVHDVDVFSGGTMDHAAEIDAALVGNATYSGSAAGKYTTKTVTAGVQTDAGVGHFTATANLTAKFGAIDEDGTIGGSVTGFVLDDVTTAPWKVILEDAGPLTDATFHGWTEVDFGGGATVNGDPASDGGVGNWQGSFYDADTTDTTKGPRTVAGTFDAVTEDASVIGGFGATRQ